MNPVMVCQCWKYVHLDICLTHILKIAEPPQTAHIEKKTLCIEEQGVKLRLTVVDTPGNCLISNFEREKQQLYFYFQVLVRLWAVMIAFGHAASTWTNNFEHISPKKAALSERTLLTIVYTVVFISYPAIVTGIFDVKLYFLNI